MKIFMSLFCGRNEGSYYRAFPWSVGLAARGHDVTLACTSPTPSRRTRVEHDQGVRLLLTPTLLDGRRVMTRLCGLYGWSPGSIAARTKELRHGNYDIVHTYEHQAHVTLPVYFAGNNGPALVADTCDHYGPGGFREKTYSPYRLRPLYQPLGWPIRCLVDSWEKNLRRRAQQLTAISSWLAGRLESFGIPAERIHCIPGCSDTKAIYPVDQGEARLKHGLPRDNPVLAFLGAGQFDLDLSLAAFKTLLPQHPHAHYLVIGKQDPFVTARATELGIRDRVIQTGWIDDSDLYTWLGCADVGLIAMRDNDVNQARWPNKIGSYTAAGRPTVCTQVSDVAKLVADHDIGLTTPVDVDAFAEAIHQVLTNPEQAAEMGQRARRVAENELSLEKQIDQLEWIYESALKGPRHAP
jgi:glycosyltransferase involved in cell wall biosynthesis